MRARQLHLPFGEQRELGRCRYCNVYPVHRCFFLPGLCPGQQIAARPKPLVKRRRTEAQLALNLRPRGGA